MFHHDYLLGKSFVVPVHCTKGGGRLDNQVLGKQLLVDLQWKEDLTNMKVEERFSEVQVFAGVVCGRDFIIYAVDGCRKTIR